MKKTPKHQTDNPEADSQDDKVLRVLREAIILILTLIGACLVLWGIWQFQADGMESEIDTVNQARIAD